MILNVGSPPPPEAKRARPRLEIVGQFCLFFRTADRFRLRAAERGRGSRRSNGIGGIADVVVVVSDDGRLVMVMFLDSTPAKLPDLSTV